MIRRDYILRMIEEFVQTLARLRQLKRDGRLEAAAAVLDEQFQKLLRVDAASVAQLSETTLLTQLIRDEPTQVVRDKSSLLVALLHEAAEVQASQGHDDASRASRLKALHLLLEVLGREDPAALPEFVPKLELLVACLRDPPLPPRTLFALMRHYEWLGDFAKAEDALFALLDAEGEHPALVELGVAFYERLLRRSDAELELGNLSRAEIQSGLAELRAKRASAASERPA